MKQTMTGTDLKEWRMALEITQPEAARLLEMSPRMIVAYELGEYPIPQLVIYACLWLYHHPPEPPVRVRPRTGPRMPKPPPPL